MLSSKDINFVGYTYKNFEIVNDYQAAGIGIYLLYLCGGMIYYVIGLVQVSNSHICTYIYLFFSFLLNNMSEDIEPFYCAFGDLI